MDMTDRTVLITGAASGIGAAAARAFAAAGARVVIADINQAGAERVADALPGALAVGVDITDASALAAMVATVAQRVGAIDLLINNAMHCSEPGFLELTPEQIAKDIGVTLVGTILCTQAVLPAMVERGRGNVINIVSVNGIEYLGNVAYSAAKAGLINFTKSIAVAYGEHGIRCNAIAPGTVATEYWQARAARDPEVLDKAARWYPLGRVGAPDDIVNAMLYLASEKSSWTTGHTLVVDGGLTAGKAVMAREIVPEGED